MRKEQKYIVNLRKSFMEQKFEFESGHLALVFAGIVRESYLDDEPNYKFSVSIDVIEVEVEDEPEPKQEQEQTSKVDEKIEENAKTDEEV